MSQTIKQAFADQDQRQFLQFENVETKLASRPDLHAFVLLNKLVPDTKDMIGGADHEKIWLNVDLKRFETIATKRDILDLVRCGVMYDRDLESLTMFV